VVVAPLEVFLKAQTRPQLTTISTYLLMSHLWMDYLDRVNQGNQVGVDSIRGFVKDMEAKWLDYDIKCEQSNANKTKFDIENQTSNGP
jgi:hypothetical protein